MLAIRAPNPDSFRASYVEIALLVDLDSIRHAITFLSRFLAEYTSVGKCATLADVIDTNVPLFTVVNVHALAIGRESKPIWLREIFGEQLNIAIGVQAIDSLEWYFLLFTCNQIQCRISKIQRGIGTDDDIIRAVQLFSVVVVRQNLILAVRCHLNDGAQNAGTIDQAALTIESIAVRIP